MISGQHLPIKGSLIFLASNNTQLYAFNKFDGRLVWNYKLQFPFNNYTPVINNTHLLIPNAPWIYCFEAKTGKAIWQRGFGSVPMYSKLQIDHEKVYAASERSQIYALNIKNDAAIDWKFELESDFSDIHENTIMDSSIYYFGARNEDDKLFVSALNTSTGELIWNTNLKKYGKEIKVFQKHKNFIVGFTDAHENGFFLINTLTGEELEVKEPKENALSNIFSIEDKLYFITKNYLTIFDMQKKDFSYIDFKLEYEVNDAFNLYFEIVQK